MSLSDDVQVCCGKTQLSLVSTTASLLLSFAHHLPLKQNLHKKSPHSPAGDGLAASAAGAVTVAVFFFVGVTSTGCCAGAAAAFGGLPGPLRAGWAPASSPASRCMLVRACVHVCV